MDLERPAGDSVDQVLDDEQTNYQLSSDWYMYRSKLVSNKQEYQATWIYPVIYIFI